MTSTNSTTTRPETEPQPRSKGPRITLAICLAAGIAAGIGLARPGASATGVATAPVQANSADSADGSGYGSPADDAAAASGGAAPVGTAGAIDIADFAFGDPISVAAGSTVTVTNRDGAAHTLTSNDGLFDTGSLGGGAAAAIVVPGQPGTYSFFCSIHPSMQGSVTVAQ